MTTIINTGEAPGAKGRRRLAEALYAQGMESTPIQHWMQGVGRLAQAASGGYQMYQLDLEDKEREKAATALLLGAPGLSAPSGASAARPEAATPPAVPASYSPGKIYSQDQLNPIDVASAAGPRPGGPVQSSSRVWGDKEAEAAGLYEPSAPSNARVMAQGGPAAVPQAAPASPAAIPPDQAAYIRKLIQNSATRDYGAALYQKAMTENTSSPLMKSGNTSTRRKIPASRITRLN